MYRRRAKMKRRKHRQLAVWQEIGAAATAKNLALGSSGSEKVHITAREIDRAVHFQGTRSAGANAVCGFSARFFFSSSVLPLRRVVL